MEEVCRLQVGTMLKNKPDLVTFHEFILVYGISTIVGYLMPNPLYSYI